MKIITTIIIILCSISLYGAEPILLDPAGKNEVITDQVKIQVIMPDSILIGKPIIIKLIIENVSQEEFSYRYSQILQDFRITIFHKGIRIQKSPFGKHDTLKIARSFSKLFVPKGKINRTIDLDKFFNIHDIGNYKMEVAFMWGKREKTIIKNIKFEVKDQGKKE